MATTGRRNGSLCGIFGDGTRVSYVTVNSFTINGATIDVSSQDDAGWKTTLAGQLSFGMNCTAMYAEDAGYGFAALYAKQVARSSVDVSIKTLVSGDDVYHGTCRITSLSQTNEAEGTSSYSVDFEGTGAPTTS